MNQGITMKKITLFAFAIALLQFSTATASSFGYYKESPYAPEELCYITHQTMDHLFVEPGIAGQKTFANGKCWMRIPRGSDQFRRLGGLKKSETAVAELKALSGAHADAGFEQETGSRRDPQILINNPGGSTTAIN